MNELTNRQYYLAARPVGMPTEDHVKHRDVTVEEPAVGQVVIKNKYISLDPAIRGWMGDEPNYIDPIEIGSVIKSSVIGHVVKSNSPDLKEGDAVMTFGAWENYSTAYAVEANKLDESMGIPLSNFMSVLGPPGLTGYFGLLRVGQPKEGQTVLVSAAAGAVGSVVSQIAKLKGCKVVGIAGSDEKCEWLETECGLDQTINYKTCGDYQQAIKQACPEGVDIYFDNVGGDMLDAALLNLNKFAKVVVCGWISTYNDPDAPGPKKQNLWQLVAKSVTIQGFIIPDYLDEFASGIEEMAGWLMTGKIKHKEHIVDGLDNILPTFHKLFDGSNTGKLIMRV